MPIRSFSRLALALGVLYFTVVAGNFFPLQPLEPLWQGQVITALVNNATLPLMALAMVQLSVLLDPDDPRLVRRHELFCRLACAAALGFLLLVPLQVHSELRQQRATVSNQVNRISQAEKRLANLRLATDQASSSADLGARFRRLNGPPISPADLAEPLPQLRARLAFLFDQAQGEINRDRSTLPPRNPLRLLPRLLRGSIICLALAFAFASFAHWPGSEITLVEELQLRFQAPQSKRLKRDLGVSQAEYIRQLHGEEES